MPKKAHTLSFDTSYKLLHDEDLRSEIKYTLMPLEYLKLKDFCENFMDKDDNADKDGTYIVKSYYFDTIHFKDYAEKQNGIFARNKYRIRTYGNTGFYRLEKKIKRGNLNKKMSGVISASDADALIEDCRELKTGERETDKIIDEMRAKGYKSSVYIQYERQAFTIDELDIRITFDRKIGMLFGKCGLFTAIPCILPVFYNDETIMEVKFKELIPKWLQDAIYTVAPSEFSVSKYERSLKYYLG